MSAPPFFPIGTDLLYRQKYIQKWVGLPRPRQDLQTQTTYGPQCLHVRPSNLEARTLRSVEHTPSKFCCDPCPVKRGLEAAVKCCVRKARFFLCRQLAENDKSLPTTLPAGSIRSREILFCFLFSDGIIIGLSVVLKGHS